MKPWQRILDRGAKGRDDYGRGDNGRRATNRNDYLYSLEFMPKYQVLLVLAVFASWHTSLD